MAILEFIGVNLFGSLGFFGRGSSFTPGTPKNLTGADRARIAESIEPGILGSLTAQQFQQFFGDTPTKEIPSTLPGVSFGGVSPGITNISQLIGGSDGLSLPEFDIIRNLPESPGRFGGGGRRPSRQGERIERANRRTRQLRKRQTEQRKLERQRLEQLSKLGKQLPEPRDFPKPERPAAVPQTPPRPRFDPFETPLGEPGRVAPRPRPQDFPSTTPSRVPTPRPAAPPRPQIGQPPSPLPGNVPKAPPARSPSPFPGLFLGAFAGSLIRPGSAPKISTISAPRINLRPPAGSPSNSTFLGQSFQTSQNPQTRARKKRDRCEKRRRGEKRRKCYRGFFKESETNTDFTRWVEIDCKTGERKNKGKKISQRAGKTGKKLGKVLKFPGKGSANKIPRGVLGL